MNNMLVQNTINQGMNAVTGGKINTAAKSLQGDKTEAAAKDFEAVFISQMLGHMFEGIKTDGMFGGGNAENIFRSMMVDEYGKMVAQSGGIGISGALQSEMLAMQEKANGVR
jgi:flagellar protein FlgJ